MRYFYPQIGFAVSLMNICFLRVQKVKRCTDSKGGNSQSSLILEEVEDL